MINQNEIPVRNVCTALAVGKSSFYDWKEKDHSTWNDKPLRNEIQGIALEFPFYGYRRITKELHRREILANHKRVLRMMREDNLLCRRKRAFKPVTTDSDHSLQDLSQSCQRSGCSWLKSILGLRYYLHTNAARFRISCGNK